MKATFIDSLQITVNLAVNFIRSIAQKHERHQPISYNLRRELNEILESFYQLLSLNLVKIDDEVIIKKFFKIGEYIVHEKLMHFGNYYYAKQKLIHFELEEKEEILRRTNVESASMLIRIRAFQLELNGIGGSTDDYFVERMPKLLDGISYIIDKQIKEVYLPTFYNLLNVHQTLHFYLMSKHPDYISTAMILIERVNKLVQKLSKYDEIKRLLEINTPLKLFLQQHLVYNSNLRISVESNDSFSSDLTYSSFSQKLRILNSWIITDHELFLSKADIGVFEFTNTPSPNIVDTALTMRIAANYLASSSIPLLEINIDAKIDKLDINEHLPSYFNGLAEIKTIGISDDEIKLLHSYNDSVLREKVAACIINIPYVEIEREMKKPHGVFEISDMELRVKLKGAMAYLCMPFKTGKEIKSNSVSVDVFYQILRPFFHFNNCIVLFISAKPCSQNLLNEIKRAQDKYDFPIQVFENYQLAKLLKINGQLN